MEVLSRRFPAVVALLALGAWSRSAATPRAPTEYEVKAAYLCSFVEFVDWPAGTGEPLVIGVLGDDPFGPRLEETIRERALRTKSIVTKRVSHIDEARRCQVVFISESEKGNLGPVLRALSGASVLTVSDVPRFAEQGGIIGFTLEDKRVRFQINVAAAERAGLRVSSRLLKLARIVDARTAVHE